MLLLNLPRGGMREFHWSTNPAFLIGQLHMLAILHWFNFYVNFSIERWRIHGDTITQQVYIAFVFPEADVNISVFYGNIFEIY
jgi:hypothetical protein